MFSALSQRFGWRSLVTFCLSQLHSATIFAAAMLLGANAHAQSAGPAVYGALPNVTEMKISPDGTTAAAIQNIGGVSVVVFYDLSGGGEPKGVNVGSADARDIEWADNDHLLLMVSQSSDVPTSSGIQTIEFFRWMSVSKSKRKATVLLGNEAGLYVGGAGALLSVLPNDPKHALLARISSSGKAGGLSRGSRIETKKQGQLGYTMFKVNLDNGRARRVETGNEHTMDWIVNEAGEAIARIDYDVRQKSRRVYARPDGGSKFKLAATIDESGATGSTITFWSEADTPNTLYATSYAGADKRALVEFDLASGKISKTLFRSPNYDIDRVLYNPRRAKLTGVRYTADMPETFHLDEGEQKTQSALKKALGGASPKVVSTSDDGNRMIVEVSYADHPKQFFLYDKAAKSLNMIAASYNALDGSVVARKEKFDIVAADGTRVPGYLTVPAGAQKTNMPLIVLPHGGPESRSDQSFDWWSFFYAARGYIVYEPNFRGSDGYGFDFRAAGYGEWGRKMQSDVTEGVQKLIANGIADPTRICIVGASYGGYAALAGATLTPDLYACAVSVNGVSNLTGMLGREARYSKLAEDYWEVRIGSRFRDIDALDAVSPSKIAGAAGAPILLIHGKDDVVVPLGQSRVMRDALQAAGKPHEYVVLDGEDHWLSTGAMRTEMLRKSIEFIDKHIGR